MARELEFSGDKELKIEYEKDNNDITIKNTSGKNLLVIAILTGGSGTINDATNVVWWQESDVVGYNDTRSVAGEKGNNVQMLKDTTLLAQAEGGSGSIVVLRKRQRAWNSYWEECGKKHYRGWNYEAVITQAGDTQYKIAREGQVVFYPYIFELDSSLDFKIVGNVESNHKGSIVLSPLEIDIKWEAKLESKIETNLNTKSENPQTQDTTTNTQDSTNTNTQPPTNP